MSQKRQPWMKWYARDWRGDGALRMCSFAARGLWADLLSLIHDEGEPYGYLRINGCEPTPAQLARMLGSTPKEIGRLLLELEDAGVFSRDETGVIYSRRMVRDKEKAERDRANGRRGGNPNLPPRDNTGVNPEDKAHSQKPQPQPEVLIHRESSAAAEGDAAAARRHEVSAKVLDLLGNNPSLLNTGRVDAWLRAGFDPEMDIYPAIRSVLARHEPGWVPRAGLKYFDGPISDAHATRTQPVPTGKPTARTPAQEQADAAVAIFGAVNQHVHDAGHQPRPAGDPRVLPAPERSADPGGHGDLGDGVYASRGG